MVKFWQMVLACGLVTCAQAQDAADPGAAQWLERFKFVPPAAATGNITPPSSAPLPAFTAHMDAPGRQMVLVSLPFGPGTLPQGLSLSVSTGTSTIVPDVRGLTMHPGVPVSVRRAMVSFPYEFQSSEAVSFEVALAPAAAPLEKFGDALPVTVELAGATLTIDDSKVTMSSEGSAYTATLVAPQRTSTSGAVVETIERGAHGFWVRVLQHDAVWPRIVEVRVDAVGTVLLNAHLQRLEAGMGTSPEFGWRVEGPVLEELRQGERALPVQDGYVSVEVQEEPVTAVLGAYTLHLPQAAAWKAGTVSGNVQPPEVIYLRSTPADKVPHQEAAWRNAVVALAPNGVTPPTRALDPPVKVEVQGDWAALYGKAGDTDLQEWPALADTQQFHVNSMTTSVPLGHDFGNVSGMPDSGVYSMNRLNHCPPIFEEYYRSGNAALREVALLWCSNYHDLSIWWGAGREGEFGGTRYNNLNASDPNFPADPEFMWRSNTAVHFCTKGYDSFFYAYEETGDPRMATALRWQVEYAARMVHTDRGEARNVGDVLDFVRLYEFTGQRQYLEEGLRLFRELRSKVGPDYLFSQSGEPIEAETPFIENDADGYAHPFAKPYIIGYALAGLPALARHVPEEPGLLEVIEAVARFLAESQDPAGGWRYPHPRSSSLMAGQAMEHAAQLARAAAVLEEHGRDIAPLLNAIERVLQARIQGVQRKRAFYGGLTGWETTTKALAEGETLPQRYARPEDRDPSRDYTEGAIAMGGNSPEGVVYFSEVLDFYLRHRPAERLYHMTPELATVMGRVGGEPFPPAHATDYAPHGLEQDLPLYREAALQQLTYPLAYQPGQDIETWRGEARAKLLEYLQAPPPRASFDAATIAEEDRGSYAARKIVFNVSADARVPAYVLVPKGQGPFPAVVALHDHGAHFSIGKEKVVQPFGVSPEVLADAAEWTGKYYGGRYIGDELAAQGYVVFAMDALFWSERGRAEGVDYTKQERVSANLLQLGQSWSGVITWDDLRSAEFVASLPEVDPTRIGAMGLSMGSHRTWMLAAASNHIAAGAAICWLGTTGALMVPKNNQTLGQSAYSMLVPGLRNWLDYPDVASIACPKPMLFYNGTEDTLFPVGGVDDAYAKLRTVWESQGAGENLETRLWPVPHEFNAGMQDAAFAWMAAQLMPRGKGTQ